MERRAGGRGVAAGGWGVAAPAPDPRLRATRAREREMTGYSQQNRCRGQLAARLLTRGPSLTVCLYNIQGKDIVHIWELGGGTTSIELMESVVTVNSIESMKCVLVLDLSKPAELWGRTASTQFYDHFSPVSQRMPPPHTPWNRLYLASCLLDVDWCMQSDVICPIWDFKGCSRRCSASLSPGSSGSPLI